MDILDLYFAERMNPKSDKEKEIFASLMQASREGNLCIPIEEKMEISSPYLKLHEGKLYLQRNWAFETEVVESIQRLFKKMTPPQYSDSSLTEEQKAAIEIALSSSLSIISGGPGTGKTFIARHLARAMGPSAKVLFAAPTGKAAAHIKGKTLHSLLGSSLEADLIIVDEASMIDAQIFANFLSAIKEGTRVVFMGDGDQLPPVESGSFFVDLQGLLPTAYLTKTHRFSQKEVLTLAEDVRRGVIEKIEPLSSFNDKLPGQILSCMRGGPHGVDAINQRLSAKASGDIPILITRTDYRLGLYNGDIGVLKGGVAKFGEKTISRAHLPPFEYAFCLSVHKSQGSEFKDVLLLVPPGSEVFGKEVLYTAVTRARRSVRIFGDEQTIQAGLLRRSRKISGLRERVKL